VLHHFIRVSRSSLSFHKDNVGYTRHDFGKSPCSFAPYNASSCVNSLANLSGAVTVGDFGPSFCAVLLTSSSCTILSLSATLPPSVDVAQFTVVLEPPSALELVLSIAEGQFGSDVLGSDLLAGGYVTCRAQKEEVADEGANAFGKTHMVDVGRADLATVSDRCVGLGENVDSTSWCGEAVAAADVLDAKTTCGQLT
jgi:hypothetical protein